MARATTKASEGSIAAPTPMAGPRRAPTLVPPASTGPATRSSAPWCGRCAADRRVRPRSSRHGHQVEEEQVEQARREADDNDGQRWTSEPGASPGSPSRSARCWRPEGQRGDQGRASMPEGEQPADDGGDRRDAADDDHEQQVVRHRRSRPPTPRNRPSSIRAPACPHPRAGARRLAADIAVSPGGGAVPTRFGSPRAPGCRAARRARPAARVTRSGTPGRSRSRIAGGRRPAPGSRSPRRRPPGPASARVPRCPARAPRRPRGRDRR